MTFLLPAWSLFSREIIRFFRQRSRVVGAFAQPVMMWVLLGAGFNQSFRPPGMAMSFSDYFFPGVILMILLFTAIFSTISIIEDRQAGFLQGVMVAPVSPSAIVLGKVLGGAALGTMQALLFLTIILAPQVTLHLTVPGFLLLLALMIGIGGGFTTVGVLLAWPMRSTQGYHAIMMTVLFPAWFLSGAVFPPDAVPAWLAWPIRLNPMSHALTLIRWCFEIGDATAKVTPPMDLLLHAGYFFACCLVLYAAAMAVVRRG